MRKIIVLNAIIILALVLSGCGNGNLPKSNEISTQTAKQPSKGADQQLNTTDSTVKSAVNSADKSANNMANNPASNSTENSVNDTKSSANNGSSSNLTSSQTTGSTEIIAKSENIMSSSDKEELLNQVDKELDSLFSSINSLEDAPADDLNLNQK